MEDDSAHYRDIEITNFVLKISNVDKQVISFIIKIVNDTIVMSKFSKLRSTRLLLDMCRSQICHYWSNPLPIFK